MFWKTPILLLGALASISHAAPIEAEAVPFLEERSLEARDVFSVFRADKRDPNTVKYASGFWAKGFTSTTSLKQHDVSLYQHCKGAADGFSNDNDGYVSTTSDSSVAEGWIFKYLKGSGFTYKIAAYENLIDVQGTLRNYNPFPHEKEYAALRGVPWAQVMGWVEYRIDPKTKQTFKMPYKLNPDYSQALYDNHPTGGAMYPLAGFPKNYKPGTMWDVAPWAFYSHCAPKKRGEMPNPARVFLRDTKASTTTTKTPGAKTGSTTDSNAVCTAADKKTGKCGTAACDVVSLNSVNVEKYDAYLKSGMKTPFPFPKAPAAAGSTTGGKGTTHTGTTQTGTTHTGTKTPAKPVA